MTDLVLARLHVRFPLLVPSAVIPASGSVVHTASERQRLVQFAASGQVPVIEYTPQLVAGLTHAPGVRGGAPVAYHMLQATTTAFDLSSASLGAITPNDPHFFRVRSNPGSVHDADRGVVRRAFDTRTLIKNFDHLIQGIRPLKDWRFEVVIWPKGGQAT
jgi:hypothetical protein